MKARVAGRYFRRRTAADIEPQTKPSAKDRRDRWLLRRAAIADPRYPHIEAVKETAMSSQITDVTPSPLISHPPGRLRHRPLPDPTTVNRGVAAPFDICDQSAVETLDRASQSVPIRCGVTDIQFDLAVEWPANDSSSQ